MWHNFSTSQLNFGFNVKVTKLYFLLLFGKERDFCQVIYIKYINICKNLTYSEKNWKKLRKIIGIENRIGNRNFQIFER